MGGLRIGARLGIRGEARIRTSWRRHALLIGNDRATQGIMPGLRDIPIESESVPLIRLFTAVYGFDEDSVYLSPAPLYHAAPLRFVMETQSQGGTVVVMPKFEPEYSLQLIEKYRATHSQWVPTMFFRMLKLPEEVRAKYDLSSLKVAIHAAVPCPPEVKRAMIEWWGPVIYEYYAATEAVGVTLINSQEALERPGSVGRDGVLGTVHICGPDGDDRRYGLHRRRPLPLPRRSVQQSHHHRRCEHLPAGDRERTRRP
ncbi:AMP-binding protein [Brevibacterium epidermidis]|uniref:AMP-binding protein n=1 Tax=Brevibacterium epidermidis TaxID=1698 RepID=UPI00351258FA